MQKVFFRFHLLINGNCQHECTCSAPIPDIIFLLTYVWRIPTPLCEIRQVAFIYSSVYLNIKRMNVDCQKTFVKSIWLSLESVFRWMTSSVYLLLCLSSDYHAPAASVEDVKVGVTHGGPVRLVREVGGPLGQSRHPPVECLSLKKHLYNK